MNQPHSSRQRLKEFALSPDRLTGGRRENEPASPKSAKDHDKAERRKYLRDYVDWLWPYRFTLLALFLMALAAAGLDMIWSLAVGALLIIPPMALLSTLWLRRVRPIYRSAQRDRVDVDGRVNETFGGTVRENIAYGRHNVTDAMVIDAARRANAHEFIAQLPQGYDTLIGERGFKLSGGQRLSIARAILADPQILILDEATSNLDTESEQLIQASLTALFKGRTTFVIAHRLSTITHADIIVAMENGRIREVGAHDDLMRQGGFYAAMVERQQQSLDRLDASSADELRESLPPPMTMPFESL